MNKKLKYSRLYLGLFSIVGLVSAVLFFVVGFLLGSDNDTALYASVAAAIMFFVSVTLLAGVVWIKRNATAGSILIQIGSASFIAAITYAVYNFSFILSGWKAILIPLTIWVPLCTPFAILIFYIWRWSKS